LLSDLHFSCTGAGQQGDTVLVDFTLALNLPVTSPVRGGMSDALLLVNEPNTEYGAPLQPGVNMFRAEAGSGPLRFTGVRIPVPTVTRPAFLRFTNIRVQAPLLIPGAGSFAVTATLSASPAATIAISNSQTEPGFLVRAPLPQLLTPQEQPFRPLLLNRDTGLNTGLLDGDASAAEPQYLISFENMGNSFRARSGTPPGQPVGPQNVPGMFRRTETGFFDPGLPAAGEWNTVGLADSGTRLMARFTGIPAGVSVFVSATAWPAGTHYLNSGPAAQLVSTDAGGGGPWSPIPAPMTTSMYGIPVGLARVPSVDGTPTAVWEVVDSSVQKFAFAVFLAYRAGTMTPQRADVETFVAPLQQPGITRVPAFNSPPTRFAALVAADTPKPDLTTTVALDRPIFAAMTGEVKGSVTVSNRGTGPTLVRTNVLTFRVASPSDPYQLDFGSLCPVEAGLGPGASLSCRFAVSSPPEGTHYLRTTTDAEGVLDESNEANNITHTQFTALACQWTGIPGQVMLPSGSGTLQIPFSTSPACPNRIFDAPEPPWLTWTVTETGPGNITLQHTANPGSAREAVITVANKNIFIFQAGGACTYSVAPKSLSFSAAGESKTARVTTQPGCQWGPLPSASWLTASSVDASGEFRIWVLPNPGPLRTATISIPGDTLAVTQYSGADKTPPIGLIDTPSEGASNLTGAIAVGGWALDDNSVARVEIWRDAVSGEASPNGRVFIGNAVFVEGARPDVAVAYPAYPSNTRGGWGLQILTNMLPGGGNGLYTLHAVAVDHLGNSNTLGSRTISCANAAAIKPFGTIDTPAAGATVAGTYVVFGWALTPQPASIPKDGSSIWVYVDGKRVGQPVFNQFRPDVSGLFPGYQNSAGPVGYYYLDTKKLTNGMHSIEWSVTDNQGRVDGLGSRYFFVQN
jgi:hypothetical protein